MLILGYKGGMRYEEARRFTINKFGIEKSLDLEYRPNKNNNWNPMGLVQTAQTMNEPCEISNTINTQPLNTSLPTIPENEATAAHPA
jgi:hypothetical protein